MRTQPDSILSPISFDAGKPQTPAHASDGELTPPTAVPAASSVIELPMPASAAQPRAARRPAIAARLEQIRAQLARNEYRIDFELLASRIIDDDVLRRGRPS